MAKKLSLPAITSTLPNDVRNFLRCIREMLPELITRTDLINSGLFLANGNDGIKPVPAEESDYTIPPSPANVTTDSGIGTIILQWNDPHYTNFSFAEIYRSTTDNLSAAIYRDKTTHNIWADSVDPQSTYFYWVRFISKMGVVGPFQGTAGIEAVTSPDPESLIELLTSHGIYTDTPYYYSDGTLVVEGVTVPAGTYIRNAYVADGTFTSAKIKSLTADKITAGTMTAAITYTGQLTVGSGGQIYGGMTDYATGTGFFLGYSGGAYKFSIGSSTSYLRWDGSSMSITGTTWAGNVITDGYIQVNGNDDGTHNASVFGTNANGHGVGGRSTASGYTGVIGAGSASGTGGGYFYCDNVSGAYYGLKAESFKAGVPALVVAGTMRIDNTTLVSNLNANLLNSKTTGNLTDQIAINNGTVCTGLNADYLDGYHAASFVRSVAELGNAGSAIPTLNLPTGNPAATWYWGQCTANGVTFYIPYLR